MNIGKTVSASTSATLQKPDNYMASKAALATKNILERPANTATSKLKTLASADELGSISVSLGGDTLTTLNEGSSDSHENAVDKSSIQTSTKQPEKPLVDVYADLGGVAI